MSFECGDCGALVAGAEDSPWPEDAASSHEWFHDKVAQQDRDIQTLQHAVDRLVAEVNRLGGSVY